MKIKYIPIALTALMISLQALMLSSCSPNPWKDLYKGMERLSISDNAVIVEKKGISCTFDGNGNLVRISGEDFEKELEGIFVDVGFNSKTILNQVMYECFLDFNTWTLPTIRPSNSPVPKTELLGIYHDDSTVITEVSLGDITWQYIYSFEDENLLKVSARILSDYDEKLHINGITYIAKGMDLDWKNTVYQFPGNSPHRLFNMKGLPAAHTGRTNYSNPVVHFETGNNHFNLLYINKHEKWATAVYRDRADTDTVTVSNQAATETYLEKGEILDELGNLYFMFPGPDPFTPIVDFYESKGWKAPEDGVNDGAVYSGHPFGTMDSGFTDLKFLWEYAEYLPTISEMGYKNIWLLPIFDHTGSSVYASNNQRDIDARYGGDEGLLIYTQKAHELGLRVLLDYVPHGPYPYLPLARDNPDWNSKRQDGTWQIEWDCVSFDYNHPEFYEYMVESVYYHASELGVDGARIDCAMGGLSNWEPLEGLRPSSSGLKAGLNVSKAIREGFLQAGKAPIIFPENFHPTPYFAPYTDAFYDMTLYRTIYELRTSGVNETTFARELTRWLSVQNATAPKGQVYLRYISNHDTVSWVWDRARPVDVYGTEKAKAIWTLTHLIDGIPMIYQGDEDPSLHRGTGEVLIDFFAELNRARTNYLGHDYDIEYILNRTAVAAFRRFNDTDDRIVLVNLSGTDQTFDIEGYSEVLYSNASVDIDTSENKALLGAYATVMLNSSD